MDFAWLTDALGGGKQLLLDNLITLVCGYLIANALPISKIVEWIIALIVKLPLPKGVKVELLMFLDRLAGSIGKNIPDTKAEIEKKYFS